MNLIANNQASPASWRGVRGGCKLKQFLSINLIAHKNNGAVIFDVKGIIKKELTGGRL